MVVANWKGFNTFIEVFTTSNETKSAKTKVLREKLARIRPDSIHNEWGLQLELVLAMEAATYLLEGDSILVMDGGARLSIVHMIILTAFSQFDPYHNISTAVFTHTSRHSGDNYLRRMTPSVID